MTDFINRDGVYRGGCIQGDTTPPTPWSSRNVDFCPNIDIENINIVDCFTQPGNHVCLGKGSDFEIYLLDSRGNAIEKLDRTFHTPDEFDAHKHNFLCHGPCIRS